MADDWKTAHEMANIVKYAPTVEAIPVEWIKKYASKKSYNDGMDCYWHFWEEDILKMLEDWGKENV